MLNFKSYLIIIFLMIHGMANAQLTFKAVDVYDSTYGIVRYEKLNYQTGGDSLRYVNGVKASGWIDDFYQSGKVLHHGYYVDGKLKLYSNYYENGQLERLFKNKDDYHCIMKIYYQDGKLKCEVQYDEGNPRMWKDFYPNGNLEYIEEYNKGFDYYVLKKSLFENGNTKEILEVVNSKKKIFSQKYYYENGQLKESGELIFNTYSLDYMRQGKWLYFDETGKLTAENEYNGGQVISEKKF